MLIPFAFAFVVPGKLKKWVLGSEFLVLEGGDIIVDLFSNPFHFLPIAFAFGVDIFEYMALLCRLVFIDIIHLVLIGNCPTKFSHGMFIKLPESFVVLLKLFFFFFFEVAFFPSDNFDAFVLSLNLLALLFLRLPYKIAWVLIWGWSLFWLLFRSCLIAKENKFLHSLSIFSIIYTSCMCLIFIILRSKYFICDVGAHLFIWIPAVHIIALIMMLCTFLSIAHCVLSNNFLFVVLPDGPGGRNRNTITPCIFIHDLLNLNFRVFYICFEFGRSFASSFCALTLW